MLKLLFFLITFNSFAKEVKVQYQSESFKEASQNESYIRFEMKSTKLGFITTSFEGYIKRFQITTDYHDSLFQQSKLQFNVIDMDTDNSARNTKMYEQSFEYEKYPEIKIQFNQPLSLSDHSKTIATITLRDKVTNIPVYLTIQQNQNQFIVEGNGKLSIKELGIPDPSIAIASVADQIDLKFKFIINP